MKTKHFGVLVAVLVGVGYGSAAYAGMEITRTSPNGAFGIDRQHGGGQGSGEVYTPRRSSDWYRGDGSFGGTLQGPAGTTTTQGGCNSDTQGCVWTTIQPDGNVSGGGFIFGVPIPVQQDSPQ